MKIGDRYPVEIAGQVVAYAEIKELESGTATLIVPATRVVMGTKTELTDVGPAEPTKQVIVDAPVQTVEEPAAPAAAAPAEPAAQPQAAPVENVDTNANQPTSTTDQSQPSSDATNA